MKFFAVAALLALINLSVRADVPHLRQHVETLASGKFDGRLTGTEGERLAGDYLVEQLKRLGAEPAAGSKDFRMAFEFTAGGTDTGSWLTLGQTTWTGSERVLALGFSDVGEVEGDVVFAGYGLVTPEDSQAPFDSYHGLDVQDKIVVVLRYSPEKAEGDLRAELSRYSAPRYKARHAREKGAKAMLIVSGPNSAHAGETIPMRFDTSAAGSGVVAGSISAEVAEALFAAAGKSLQEAQTALDGGNPHVSGFALEGVRVKLSIQLEHKKQTGYNVIGVLPGKDTSLPPLLIGAHYDHLGRGENANSLAKKEEAGGIHHGADDNASGCAAVLEIGRELARIERPRSVLLAFWSGEELGLVGSEAYVTAAKAKGASDFAYMNFDMVGRSRDNGLTLQAVGSSSVWPQLIEQANVAVGFDLSLVEDPYLPTDATALYKAGVPTLNFFTGAHEDYHRPSDKAETIAYEELDRVADLGTRIAKSLLALPEQPDYVKLEQKREQSGDRDTVRAFTGTIPDYTTEVEGLRLSGVIAGGPADQAGLREGDVIVEFNGQTIANIYDYTYALDSVKIGVETKVVVMREGERVELSLTPATR